MSYKRESVLFVENFVCGGGAVRTLSACLSMLMTFVIIVHLSIPGFSPRTDVVIQPFCPERPPHLVGSIDVQNEARAFSDLEQIHSELNVGGQWRPGNCTSIHQVALVIPYRDRDRHLRTFLHHMHPFLQKQQLDYGIYVVQQASSNSFNRGMLMNIGFMEAMKQRQWKCFIFHDVDLLPENDRNIYSCPDMPRHMAVGMDTAGYRLFYEDFFGGVAAFSTSHFTLINGFSNKFFGWGGEDDDLYLRIVDRGLNLTRYPTQIARYKALSHVKDIANIHRFSLLKTSKQRVNTDGLSSLNGSYLARTDPKKLFTLIYAELNQAYIEAH